MQHPHGLTGGKKAAYSCGTISALLQLPCREYTEASAAGGAHS